MGRKVRRDEIIDYQTYREQRDAEQERIFAVKKPRRIHAGDHLTFLFENADTVRYQVQEMLLAEQIVKEADIVHELDTYNELIGDDGELGCVLLIEIDDRDKRDELLARWLALPGRVYVALEDGRKVYATHDARQVGEDRLSSVQYIKFDTGGQVPVAVGSDLPELSVEAKLDDAQRAALREDLET